MVLNCPLPSLATIALGVTRRFHWLAKSLWSAAENHEGYVQPSLPCLELASFDCSRSRREAAVLLVRCTHVEWDVEGSQDVRNGRDNS